MDAKACKHCYAVKPLESFYRWSRSKDGRADWCKACRSSHDKSVYVSKTKPRFKEWYASNKVAHREGNKRWIVDNYERHREYQRNFQNARRQTLVASTDTPLTVEQWQDILLTFNNACAYCLIENVPLEQEHMQPISKGGTHTADNVIPACRTCNASKGGKSFLHFISSTLNLEKAA